MTTETEARAIARRYPIEARAGWLLACDAPANISKGQRLFDQMAPQDQTRATTYRDWCRRCYVVGALV